jgi:hypothetical protein
VTTLVELQEEYRAWLDHLPTNLDGSPLADKLQAIAELDLEGAAGHRSAARLRPRLTQESRYASAVIELLNPTPLTHYPQLVLARTATARW